MSKSSLWIRAVASLLPAVVGEPTSAEMAALLRHLSPHFHESAGSPVAGLTRGKGTYSGQGFDVGKPERVMPTGAGRLSAMVGYGDRLELELSTTEYFNALADNRSGAVEDHINSLLSPGHLSIELGGVRGADILKFDQHLDFARGSVVIELETRDGVVRTEVAGDMLRDNLVITVMDGRRSRGEALVHYDNWRNSMSVSGAHGRLTGVESPDLAGVARAKAQSMSLAIEIGCIQGENFAAQADAQAGTIVVPRQAAGDFVVVVSVRCAHGTAPIAAAAASWSETARLRGDARERERLDWWQEFWRQSWLELSGPGADNLARLWYTTLYSYACVGEGPMLPKFNGGPGLVYKDARSWGDGYWWQNQREISFWPMAAAGHRDFTRKSVLFFNQAFPASVQSASRFRLGGLWLFEQAMPRDWSAPFGENYSVQENRLPAFAASQIAPEAALEARQQAKAGFNAENFSAEFEFTQAVFDYVQYSGDAEVARKIAAPWLKGSVVTALNLLTLAPDGKYHVQCADATEQWWKVDDPAPVLAGIYWSLETLVRHGKELGLEEALVAAAADRLAKLAPLPTVGGWNYRTEKPGSFYKCPPENIWSGDALLAPCRLSSAVISHNVENPELYSVFPFGIVDLNSRPADLERARRTFAHRFFKNAAGWSQCGIQAARLGLPDAIEVILDHARTHQKWPYGGWISPGGKLYPHSVVSDCPYFDAAGVEVTALQEALLQSQAPAEEAELFESGVIRLLPAVSDQWSGRFLLHTRGGFAVTVRFNHGRVQAARVQASRDANLRVMNPFPSASIEIGGQNLIQSDRIFARRLHQGDSVTLAENQR